MIRELLDLYTRPIPGWLPPNVITYYLLMIGCFAYAFARGGTPEKVGAAILTIASLLTAAAISAPGESFRSVELGVLIVDIVCFAAFLILALRAERFWPLWVAALQLIGTAVHVVKFVDPEVIRRVYAFFLAVWSYPMIVLMVAGTWRHARRLDRFGADLSWSPARAETAPGHWYTNRRTLPRRSERRHAPVD